MHRARTSRLLLPSLVLIAAALAGCETMSKKQCLSADWFQVGYQAGRDGRERAHIEDIAESCAKVNVTPDRRRYFDGWEQGLREYCTPENGFYLGRNGTRVRSVCPPATAGRFEDAYRRGYRIFEARQYVDQLEDRRRNLENLLEKANTDEKLKRIRDELAELDIRLRYARDTLQQIESETRPPR